MNSLILLSGGLDSTVSLALARENTDIKLALTFDYGQRAAIQEIKAAESLAEYYGLPHRTLTIPWLAEAIGTALLNRELELPTLAPEDFDRPDRLRSTADAVWVPNRNGLFINIAACLAETMDCDIIVCGFNAEEAATFPDNTPEFVAAVNNCLKYSTRGKVQAISLVQDLTKVEMIRVGQRLGVPWRHIWSCYRGESAMCGQCESCRRLQRAAHEAGFAPNDLFVFGGN